MDQDLDCRSKIASGQRRTSALPPVLSPSVAIVTPTYNGARYLDETMRSVQDQTWPHLVHVILDNCSNDATPQIVASHANGRIPILYHRNEQVLGQRDNWNKAFSLAPADATYVRLLCDDDTLYPSSTEKMVSLAESDPAIGVVGSRDNGHLQDFRWPETRQVFSGDEAVSRALLGQGVIMPMQMMWRKSIVDQKQPLFEGFVEGGAFDVDTVLDLLTRSKFGFLHEELGFTRAHENSVTNLVYGEKTHSNERDHFDLFRKYGPSALGADYQAQFIQFRRIYVREILTWWWQDRSSQHLDSHFRALERGGQSFGLTLVADAVSDWLLRKLRLRRDAAELFAPPEAIARA